MSIDTARVPTRSSVRATATWVFWMNLYMAGWFWLMATIVITAALVVINVVGEVNTSVVAFARQGAIWFPFSVLIAITAAYLPVHVAAGLTRRSLSFGSLIGATGTALVYGGAFAGLLLLERAVFSAFGWQWRILDDITYTSWGIGPVIVSTTLIFVVAYVSGLLVGMTYQRAGGWFGTLALPLTAGPVLLVFALFAQDAGPFSTSALFGGDQPFLVASAATLLIAGAMAFAFDRLTRGASVPNRTS
ncbi:hypothetical protein ASD16_14780 [Cellulomonas sp. Root485]|jgi:hypothetical protein|uniref:hypothetical protein n=1 Tax=Cellulomonas sp. Root485 TaxID=1736546 RepID=UPI0007021709|nr:hypothetical protein [Cellulomonas sp. Root485]KQY21928.1 hypothetical protein ASD16_14780 [Cellulomonas sp. Root485]